MKKAKIIILAIIVTMLTVNITKLNANVDDWNTNKIRLVLWTMQYYSDRVKAILEELKGCARYGHGVTLSGRSQPVFHTYDETEGRKILWENSVDPNYNFKVTVWTKHGSTNTYYNAAVDGSGSFIKASEMKFNSNGKKGQIIFRTYAYNRNTSNLGVGTTDVNDMFRITWNTTDSNNRIMTIERKYDVNGIVDNNVGWKSYINSNINTTEIYFNAVKKISFGGTSENEAVLIGVIINNASPHYTVAKYGWIDKSQPLDWKWWASNNSHNPGYFSVGNNPDNFDGDSQSGIPSNPSLYPNPENIVASKLPTVSDIENLVIAFDDNSAPSF